MIEGLECQACRIGSLPGLEWRNYRIEAGLLGAELGNH